MSISLEEILMLVGRLDDSSRFDSARERLRRFLTRQVATASVARELIEQCQHTPGAQYHRVLQDLVSLLGRLLGYQTEFAYADGTMVVDGRWSSQGQLTVLLDVRTDQTTDADFDARLSLAPLARRASDAPTLRMCVVTPLYAGRQRLEVAAGSRSGQIRIVSLRSLLALADAVASRKLTHDDTVRLLLSTAALDFVIELLTRVGNGESSCLVAVDRPVQSGAAAVEPRFWLATVAGDGAISAEQFLERVVLRRQVLGVSGVVDEFAARAGDSVCFHIPDKGIVGHALIVDLEDGGAGLRDGHQYARRLRLDNIELHVAEPVAPDIQTRLRLRAMPSRPHDALVRISREEFDAVARERQSIEREQPQESLSVT